ncbi:MAG: outer membrane protein [Cyanobium sp.]
MLLAPVALSWLVSPGIAAPVSGADQLRLDAASAAAIAAQPQQIAQSYGGSAGPSAFEQAQGWYLTLGAGASRPSNTSWSTDDLAVLGGRSVSGAFHYGGGVAIDGGVGYDFGAIRTELTYSYNRASLNGLGASFNGNRVGTTDVSGIVNKNDVLASAYVDFPFGRWVPYIGAGIGYSNLSTPSFTVGDFRSGGLSRGVFGWQAKAGIAYGIDYNWDVYAEGVYQGAGGYDAGDVHVGSFNNWGGKLGFRYRFGHQASVVVEQPAPAPAPAPMPEAAPMPEPAPPVRGLW